MRIDILTTMVVMMMMINPTNLEKKEWRERDRVFMICYVGGDLLLGSLISYKIDMCFFGWAYKKKFLKVPSHSNKKYIKLCGTDKYIPVAVCPYSCIDGRKGREREKVEKVKGKGEWNKWRKKFTQERYRVDGRICKRNSVRQGPPFITRDHHRPRYIYNIFKSL